MPLRVISGKAKGRQLKLVPGEGTRPIMDRVKEALFNILGSSIEGASFVDLYAGTGSVGIEALSRGAERVVFVENARHALETIKSNLTLTKLTDNAEIVKADVMDFLRQPKPEAFEFVYIAPPQYKNLWYDTLLLLDKQRGRIHPDGVVIVQIDPHEKKEITLETLVPIDERRYGKTLLWFFEYPSE